MQDTQRRGPACWSCMKQNWRSQPHITRKHTQSGPSHQLTAAWHIKDTTPSCCRYLNIWTMNLAQWKKKSRLSYEMEKEVMILWFHRIREAEVCGKFQMKQWEFVNSVETFSEQATGWLPPSFWQIFAGRCGNMWWWLSAAVASFSWNV